MLLRLWISHTNKSFSFYTLPVSVPTFHSSRNSSHALFSLHAWLMWVTLVIRAPTVCLGSVGTCGKGPFCDSTCPSPHSDMGMLDQSCMVSGLASWAYVSSLGPERKLKPLRLNCVWERDERHFTQSQFAFPSPSLRCSLDLHPRPNLVT